MTTVQRLTALPLLIILALATLPLPGCSNPATLPNENPARAETTGAHAHAIPGETCFICDPSKRDPGRLWCKEHGRYEDRCFICHPELEDKDRLFCTEHFLYEDECFLCHPELIGQAGREPEPEARRAEDHFDSSAESSDMPEALYCREHDVYENECGICHPELLAHVGVGEGLKVRLSSTQSARKAGVRVGRPGHAPKSVGTTVLAEVTFNENKLAVISPLAGGVISDVHADVGMFVEKGALLAEINSPAIADAKSAYVKALVDRELKRQAHEREQRLVEREVSSRQDYQEARAAYDAAANEVDRARQQLLNLGFTGDEVAGVEETRSTSSTLPLRAPFAGTITDREAVPGTAVDAGDRLFLLADLSTMWLDLSVPEMEAARLAAGAEILAEFDAMPGETFEGELTWIAPNIDHATRTARARALVPNPDNRLRSGLFGRALIAELATPAGLTVPQDAVQIVDNRPVVFAKLEDDLYETRVIRTGANVDGRLVIIDGLSPHDEIVVAESYLLKSELLKSRLGAGCVHE